LKKKNFLLNEEFYTLEEELLIANHVTIEICECCGDYYPIIKYYCDKYTNNFIEITLEGYFYCEKCLG